MPHDKAALIVIDMLNTYEHEDGEPLKRSARRAVPAIAALLAKAREQEARIVYVNDNHGDWTAGRGELVERTRMAAGPELVDDIAPPDDVPFLLKARHSIFYETPIEYLLNQDGIRRIVLTGQVTEQCILYSALDGYIRHFQVAVVPEAVAHIDERLADAALAMMQRNMRAEVVDRDRCDFAVAHARFG
jgi:nicotinamidase-related amidase